MDTNGHEWDHEREIQNHEWTRMGGREPRITRNTRKENSEPRMDTNGHEWVGGNHETHEWTRKDNSEPRMDTNGWEGTTKHTKGTKEKYRTTNGHEWTRMGPRKRNSEPRMGTNGHEWVGGNHETHEWTRKDNSEPRMDTKGRVFPLFLKGILHITHCKSKSYIFGTFEGLRKTGNSYFSDKTLIFDSNLDKTLTFTPLPAYRGSLQPPRAFNSSEKCAAQDEQANSVPKGGDFAESNATPALGRTARKKLAE